MAAGTGFAVIFIVIVDLLMTRQILAYTNFTEFVMFILTIGLGYGIGSWVLLGYTEQVSKELRTKSQFIKLSNWIVIISQFSFLAILLFILFSMYYWIFVSFSFWNKFHISDHNHGNNDPKIFFLV